MTIEFRTGMTLESLTTTDDVRRQRERDFWRLADRNGPAFIDGTDGNGQSIISKYPLESGDRWAARKKRSKAPSLVRHIADHYVAHVFRAPAERTGVDARADEILQDADGLGTPLPNMLRSSARKGLIDGCSYLLTDTNQAAEPQTAADAAAAGARFVVRDVGADQVVTEISAPGGVVEAVLRLIDEQGRPFLWHVTSTQQRRAELDSKGLSIERVGPWQTHRYGACPLVRLDRLPAFVPPVAESQKRLAVLDSLLQSELHASAFSQPVFTGVDPEKMAEVIRGNANILAFPNSDAKAFMLASDPAQAESIRTERDAELQNAYREAKVSPVQATPGAPESGVARAYRFVDADVELATISEAVERVEVALWKRLASAGACTAPTVTYPRSFIPTDEAAELDKLLAVWSSNLPDTLRRAAVERYAEAVGLSDEDLADLEAELDAMMAKPDEPPPPVPGLPPAPPEGT